LFHSFCNLEVMEILNFKLQLKDLKPLTGISMAIKSLMPNSRLPLPSY
jgi:hypothetical protein